MSTLWSIPSREDVGQFWSNPCNTLDPVAVGLFDGGYACSLSLDLSAPGLALVAAVESFDRQARARFSARYSVDPDGLLIPDVADCVLFGGPGHLPDDLLGDVRHYVKHAMRVESLAHLHRRRKISE